MKTQSFFSYLNHKCLDLLAELLVRLFSIGSGSILAKLKISAANRRIQAVAWVLLALGFMGYMLDLLIPGRVPSIALYGFEFLIYIGYFLVVLVRPKWGLPIFGFLLPFLTYRPLVACISFMALFLFTNSVSKERLKEVLANRLNLGIGLFMLFLFITAIFSAGWKESLTNFILYFLISFLLYFLVLVYIDHRQDLYNFVLALVLGGCVVSLYGIYQYLILDFTSLKWVDPTFNPLLSKRAYATFGNPNLFAQYLILIAPLSFVLLWNSKSWRNRIVFAGIFGIIMLSLVLTFSRGSWLAIFVAGVLLALMIDRRLFLIGIAFGAVSLNFLPEVIMDRIESITNSKDSSSAYRFQMWQSAFNMIRDYWITGIGMDSQTFLRVYPDYMMPDVRVYHFHNIFLQQFVTGGIMGIFALLFLFYFNMKTMVSVICGALKNSWLNLLAKGLISSLIAIAIAGLTEDIWRHYRVDFMFWITISLAAVVYQIHQKECAR